MRILLFNLSGSFGNNEFILFQLALGLKKQKADFTVACLKNSHLFFKCKRSNIAIFEIEPNLQSSRLKLNKKLVQFIREQKLSLIYSSSSDDRAAASAAALTTKIKHIASVNDFNPLHEGLIDRKLTEYALHHVITSSKSIVNTLISREKFDSSKISVVLPGLNEHDYFRDDIKRRNVRGLLGFADDHIIIGNIGNLAPFEGQALLLEAFADVLPEYTRARVMVVGEGELKDELIRQAQRFGVQKQVLFTGHREEFSSMYSSFDLYVQPYAEGNKDVLPPTVMQALAYRLPLIVTNVGDMAEFVEEGKNGFVLPQRSKNLLADKITALLSDDSLRETFGDYSFNIFKSRFVNDRMTNQTVEVFRKILDSQA
jgi:glycosyltransferase involved in cell wall biosynthesis